MLHIFKLLVMAQGRKTGGRQKGTPNKPSPLKERLRELSEEYYMPRPQTNPDGTPRKLNFRTKDGEIYDTVILQDADCKPLMLSNYEVDMLLIEDPKERAIINEKLLRYHTPQQQSVSTELSLSGDIATTIEERLAKLAAENDN